MMLNKKVTKLKAKLEIEAIQYEMQVKLSKTNNQLLSFSLFFFFFFFFFVAVFWGNYYGACN
jgi:hypothetical protein